MYKFWSLKEQNKIFVQAWRSKLFNATVCCMNFNLRASHTSQSHLIISFVYIIQVKQMSLVIELIINLIEKRMQYDSQIHDVYDFKN